MIKLVKNVHLYSPEDQGKKDILILGSKIGHIADAISEPEGLGDVEVYDGTGFIVVPGFMDGHVHITGGGGEGGPATRTPEVMLSQITTAGITTVVGCLGTDSTTRHLNALLAKARGLEQEGVTTYIYTGAYQMPTPTFTGSVREDVAMIDKVIGVGEVAISDHRSSQPLTDDLAHLAAETRVGGLIGGKPGIVHFHVGSGPRGIQPILDIVKNTEIPASQFLPTHMMRSKELLEMGVEFTQMGGTIDLTAGRRTAEVINSLLKKGVETTNITISSDGNGSMPRFDDQGNFVGLGVGSLATVFSTWKQCVLEYGLPIPKALNIVCTNVARLLHLKGEKGEISVGADADMLLLSQELNIDKVFAKGRLMVDAGEAIVKGTFER